MICRLLPHFALLFALLCRLRFFLRWKNGPCLLSLMSLERVRVFDVRSNSLLFVHFSKRRRGPQEAARSLLHRTTIGPLAQQDSSGSYSTIKQRLLQARGYGNPSFPPCLPETFLSIDWIHF